MSSSPGLNLRDNLRIVPSDDLSSSTIIRPERPNLGIEAVDATLRYPLGPFRRGSIKASLMSLFGHRDNLPKPVFVEAMRGLNLRISYGERVALIGHNGSGKSTLLRALAGIYPLESGSLTVVGRIGALLNISLGFEVESTGRENIYYRGMAMGYSRRQIAEVEKEIVRFVDLGEFIDMPMRTYSAGMFVRLGFAVSTQFSPEILLVDEVFGAGDASFAHRALDRMTRIVEDAGIFVIATHDLRLIRSFCGRVIWMDHGSIVRDGSPEQILPDYERHMAVIAE